MLTGTFYINGKLDSLPHISEAAYDMLVEQYFPDWDTRPFHQWLRKWDLTRYRPSGPGSAIRKWTYHMLLKWAEWSSQPRADHIWVDDGLHNTGCTIVGGKHDGHSLLMSDQLDADGQIMNDSGGFPIMRVSCSCGQHLIIDSTGIRGSTSSEFSTLISDNDKGLTWDYSPQLVAGWWTVEPKLRRVPANLSAPM